MFLPIKLLKHRTTAIFWLRIFISSLKSISASLPFSSCLLLGHPSLLELGKIQFPSCLNLCPVLHRLTLSAPAPSSCEVPSGKMRCVLPSCGWTRPPWPLPGSLNGHGCSAPLGPRSSSIQSVSQHKFPPFKERPLP